MDIIQNIKQFTCIIFAAVLFGVVASPTAYSNHTVNTNMVYTEEAAPIVSESLVMIETILEVYTDTPNVHIVHVHIFNLQGHLMSSLNGCGHSTCSFDLMNLPSGLYKVVVYKSNSTSFAGTVVK